MFNDNYKKKHYILRALGYFYHYLEYLKDVDYYNNARNFVNS